MNFSLFTFLMVHVGGHDIVKMAFKIYLVKNRWFHHFEKTRKLNVHIAGGRIEHIVMDKVYLENIKTLSFF